MINYLLWLSLHALTLTHTQNPIQIHTYTFKQARQLDSWAAHRPTATMAPTPIFRANARPRRPATTRTRTMVATMVHVGIPLRCMDLAQAAPMEEMDKASTRLSHPRAAISHRLPLTPIPHPLPVMEVEQAHSARPRLFQTIQQVSQSDPGKSANISRPATRANSNRCRRPQTSKEHTKDSSSRVNRWQIIRLMDKSCAKLRRR